MKHLLELPKASTHLTLWKADLAEEGSFDEAIRGCTGVFHVATPMDFESKDPEVSVSSLFFSLLFLYTKLGCIKSTIYTVRKVKKKWMKWTQPKKKNSHITLNSAYLYIKKEWNVPNWVSQRITIQEQCWVLNIMQKNKKLIIMYCVVHPSQNEVIRPTINGMLSIMKACKNAKTVRRLVFTSSAGTLDVEEHRKPVYDETSWSDLDFVRSVKMTGWVSVMLVH